MYLLSYGTEASASRTLHCPGILKRSSSKYTTNSRSRASKYLPATGCIAKRVWIPFERNRLTISAMAYCAFATAMP